MRNAERKVRNGKRTETRIAFYDLTVVDGIEGGIRHRAFMADAGSARHSGGAPGMNGILRVYPESGLPRRSSSERRLGQSVIVLCNLDSPSASRMGDWLLTRMLLAAQAANRWVR